MKDTIFETKTDGELLGGMPRTSNDPDVLRTATGLAGFRQNHMPAMIKNDRNVQNIERPRRGHGY
jgi:hypothetical protein